MRILLSETYAKLERYKQLIKKFIVFAFSGMLTRSITILFAPIAMHMLTPADYGLIALATSFSNALNAFLGLGLRQALPMFYFQQNRQEKIDLLTDISIIYICFSLPILGLLYCNMHMVQSFVFLNAASNNIILLSLSISFMYFFVEMLYQLLRFRQKAWTLTLIQTSVACIILCTNFLCICIFKWGPIGMLLGQTVGMATACLSALFLHRHDIYQIQLNTKRTVTRFKSYIFHSLPFIPSMLFGIILTSSDRWVLAYRATLHDVGIYSLANTVAQLVNMIALYAMLGSYVPHMLQSFVQQKENIHALEKENQSVMWFCMISLGTILAILFSCSKSLLVWIIPIKYHEAINYMGLLLTGSVFYLGTHFLNSLILHHKKSMFMGIILIVPALLNIILNILFVPHFGLYGCVVATTIAYAIYFLITLWYNHRLWHAADRANTH